MLETLKRGFLTLYNFYVGIILDTNLLHLDSFHWKKTKRFHCDRCGFRYCGEHAGIHFRKGEFIPEHYGKGNYKRFSIIGDVCEDVDCKESSDMDAESESDTW